jgi:uncharacterized protein (DUF362 family)
MDRRTFLHLAAAPALLAANENPTYRIQSHFSPAANPGMPGPYRGRVIRVHSKSVIDDGTEKVDSAVAQKMIADGMCSLTGAKTNKDAWASFFNSSDVVGIKVNCSGAPDIKSRPEVVGAIVGNLTQLGIKPSQIYIYERFLDQLQSVHYDRYVPEGVHILAVETPRGSIAGYDPKTYVEVDFFGEDDTRSNLVRLVTERFTKIINVPNVKDHRASGVTGCLKNIAYGNFSNVARSHMREKTNTYSFIGTLASVEPLRSKTVLNVMDGIVGVWHGGPFSVDKKFRYYPKIMMFGTDPIAMDHTLLDIIEQKRLAEGALSVYDRSMSNIDRRTDKNPRTGQFIREPGHIEFAAKLGLGEFDKSRIKITDLEA